MRACRKFCGCPSDAPNVCTSWSTTLRFVMLNTAACAWKSVLPTLNVRLALKIDHLYVETKIALITRYCLSRACGPEPD